MAIDPGDEEDVALVAAMRMDWLSSAIGTFELTEYLGLALVWGALAVTAPFLAAERQEAATRSA